MVLKHGRDVAMQKELVIPQVAALWLVLEHVAATVHEVEDNQHVDQSQQTDAHHGRYEDEEQGDPKEVLEHNELEGGRERRREGRREERKGGRKEKGRKKGVKKREGREGGVTESKVSSHEESLTHSIFLGE